MESSSTSPEERINTGALQLSRLQDFCRPGGVPIAAKLHHNSSPSLARTLWQVDINYVNCTYGGTAHNQIQILSAKWKTELKRT